MTLFAAAMDDDAIVNGSFYAVGSLLGNEIEASDIQAVKDKIREAEQKFAEHRRMEVELDEKMRSLDRRWDDLKRKIAERNIRLYAIKQKYHLINQSSDDDHLN